MTSQVDKSSIESIPARNGDPAKQRAVAAKAALERARMVLRGAKTPRCAPSPAESSNPCPSLAASNQPLRESIESCPSPAASSQQLRESLESGPSLAASSQQLRESLESCPSLAASSQQLRESLESCPSLAASSQQLRESMHCVQSIPLTQSAATLELPVEARSADPTEQSVSKASRSVSVVGALTRGRAALQRKVQVENAMSLNGGAEKVAQLVEQSPTEQPLSLPAAPTIPSGGTVIAEQSHNYTEKKPSKDSAGEAAAQAVPAPVKGKGKGPGAPPGPPQPTAEGKSKAAGKGAEGKSKAAGKGGKGVGPKFDPSKVALEKRDSNAPFQRKLYWKPMDLETAEGTIFSANERASSPTSSRGIDTDALKRMFGTDPNSRESAQRSQSIKVLQKVQQKATGIKLFSDHRARNIAIVLRRLPVSTKEFARMLKHLRWELTSLSSDDLEQVLEVIPTQEEAALLREYRSADSRVLLRDVERMVLPLALLRRSAARVRLVVIARTAKMNYQNNARALSQIREACRAISASAMLKEVMILALELGNYINHGDSKRGAKAISIGSLITLKDFKAGRISSMHFLCASLYRANPSRNVAEVLNSELRPVVAASKLQVQTIQFEFHKLQRDLEVISCESSNYADDYTDAQRSSEGSVELDTAEGCRAGDVTTESSEEDVSPGARSVANSWTESEELSAHEATRFLEDVMKIRGSATRRLHCMKSVLEKRFAHLQDVELSRTVSDIVATLKFCGMVPPAQMAKKIPNDLEPLLQQTVEFLKVFAHHWDEVRADLPRFTKLFAEDAKP